VISLVDLGVIRSVDVSQDQVRVDSRRRSLGCPASRMDCATPIGGADQRRSAPTLRSKVISDDSWSTDRITPNGREKLRASGLAPPAPREVGGPKLIQLPVERLPSPTAAPRTRRSRTSSGRRLAAQCATAAAAGSISSSSRRSDGSRRPLAHDETTSSTGQPYER